MTCCRVRPTRLTGVPAPVGAGLVFLPMYLSFETGWSQVQQAWLVSLWLLAIAFLAISNVPTLSWGKLRPPRSVRLGLILLVGMIGAAALTEPWWTLVGICAVYLALMPLGIVLYARVKRRRAALAEPVAPPPA